MVTYALSLSSSTGKTLTSVTCIGTPIQDEPDASAANTIGFAIEFFNSAHVPRTPVPPLLSATDAKLLLPDALKQKHQTQMSRYLSLNPPRPLHAIASP